MDDLFDWMCDRLARAQRRVPGSTPAYMIACMASVELGRPVTTEEVVVLAKRCGYETRHAKHLGGVVSLLAAPVWPHGPDQRTGWRA